MKPSRSALRRVEARPHLDDWSDGEPITIAEAAALLGRDWPITASTLRSAIRRGEMAAIRLAGKLFVTKAALREALTPHIVRPETASAPKPISQHQLNAAQAAALDAVREHRRRLRATKEKPRTRRG